MKWPAHRRQDEQGIILPLVAILLVAMLGFVALSVDIGRVTITRRQLQNAVDAGAHAGVQVLPGSPDDAEDAAYTWTTLNKVAGSEIVSIEVSKTNVADDTITVTARRTVDFTFAKALKLYSTDVTMTASAVVGSVVGGTGVMPFGLVDMDRSSPGFGYTFGNTYTLQQPPGNHWAPGNYGLLALDGRGGSDLRETIAAGGSNTLYRIGDHVDTEPGQKNGPVHQGLDSWAASHNDSMSSECSDWAGSHTYKDGKLAVTSKCRYRVILIPIIDEWPNGRKSVEILGFAQMYLIGDQAVGDCAAEPSAFTGRAGLMRPNLDKGGNGNGNGQSTPTPTPSPSPAPSATATPTPTPNGGCKGNGNGNSSDAIVGVFLEDSWSHPGIRFGAVNDYGTRVVKLK